MNIEQSTHRWREKGKQLKCGSREMEHGILRFPDTWNTAEWGSKTYLYPESVKLKLVCIEERALGKLKTHMLWTRDIGENKKAPSCGVFENRWPSDGLCQRDEYGQEEMKLWRAMTPTFRKNAPHRRSDAK